VTATGIDAGTAQSQLKSLFHCVYAFLADLVLINRLGNNSEQVVDIRLLLIAQGVGVTLQNAVSVAERGNGHRFPFHFPD
jgi:hypothetical protein